MEKDTVFSFDWLPGYKEIMACQENDAENVAQKTEDVSVAEENVSFAGQETLLPPEELQKEEQAYWSDYEYLVRTLPLVARESWAAADAVLDRYEYEGSSIYAEFPDKTSIQRIVDTVYEKMKYYEDNVSMTRLDGTEVKNPYYVREEDRGIDTPLRDLIYLMVCWNLLYRRQRYYRRKKVFPRADLM